MWKLLRTTTELTATLSKSVARGLGLESIEGWIELIVRAVSGLEIDRFSESFHCRWLTVR